MVRVAAASAGARGKNPGAPRGSRRAFNIESLVELWIVAEPDI